MLKNRANNEAFNGNGYATAQQAMSYLKVSRNMLIELGNKYDAVIRFGPKLVRYDVVKIADGMSKNASVNTSEKKEKETAAERTKKCDMLAINPEELLKVADKVSLNNLAVFGGYGNGYIYSALHRQRIPRELLDKICRFYGADASKIVVTEKPKQVEEDKAFLYAQYTDLRFGELKKRIVDIEDSVSSLLSDCEKRFDEKIERIHLKEDRDNAELRKMITSIQTRLEQINNGRMLNR